MPGETSQQILNLNQTLAGKGRCSCPFFCLTKSILLTVSWTSVMVLSLLSILAPKTSEFHSLFVDDFRCSLPTE